MNEDKAKFILSAYRPEHEDRDDPEFREALAFIASDASLKDWFEDQLRFDRAMLSAVREIPVPDDLLGSILAGARVSATKRHALRDWIASPAVRALAAVIVIGVFVLVAFLPGLEAQAHWKRAALDTLTEMSEKRQTLDLKTGDAKAIYEWLKVQDPELASSFPVPVDAVGAYGCKGVRSEDGLVTIVCFEYGGKMFHLASYHLSGRAATASPKNPIVEEEGRWLSATWLRGDFAHMLITSDKSVTGKELLRVIDGFNA